MKLITTSIVKSTFSKIVIAAAATLFASSVFASTGEYRLMGESLAGTKIRNVDATSPISFNKSYVELSSAEQELFKQQFEDLSVNDRPPFPAKGLRAIYRPILNKNKSIAEPGVLKMVAEIDANGNVDSVRVIDSPNAKLERYATRIVEGVKFEPATCGGETCAMDFPIRLILQ